MKQAYTQFISYLAQRSQNDCATAEGLIENAKGNVVDGQTVGEWMCLEMQLQVMRKKCLHLFLPDRPFCDWLVGCSPGLDSRHAACIQELIGTDRVGVLHFPTGSKIGSAAFCVTREINRLNSAGNLVSGRMLVLAHSMTSRDRSYGLLHLDGSNPKTIPGEGVDVEFTYKWNLIISLGMYCQCFPEVVIDGLPEDVKHPAHHQYSESRVIGIADKIRTPTGTHASPTAHFRRGHFRFLASPMFAKKRFQTVFVHETFVNGKAKTVLSPDEVTA